MEFIPTIFGGMIVILTVAAIAIKIKERKD
jgi:hypothetical protein